MFSTEACVAGPVPELYLLHCAANLVSSRFLGSGDAKAVYKLTYRMADAPTTDYDFKHDLGGRIGLYHLLIS